MGFLLPAYDFSGHVPKTGGNRAAEFVGAVVLNPEHTMTTAELWPDKADKHTDRNGCVRVKLSFDVQRVLWGGASDGDYCSEIVSLPGGSKDPAKNKQAGERYLGILVCFGHDPAKLAASIKPSHGNFMDNSKKPPAPRVAFVHWVPGNEDLGTYDKLTFLPNEAKALEKIEQLKASDSKPAEVQQQKAKAEKDAGAKPATRRRGATAKEPEAKEPDEGGDEGNEVDPLEAINDI